MNRLLSVRCAALLPLSVSAGEVWASNERDDTVSVIDTATMEVIKTYDTGVRPRTSMLHWIGAATNTLFANTQVDARPRFAQFAKDRTELWVSASSGPRGVTDSIGLRISDLGYDWGQKRALDHVSLTLQRGEFCALLGSNGAGKSTLFGLLTRLFTSREGRIEVAGHDLGRSPRRALAEIGVVFQSSTLDLDLTVQRNLWWLLSAKLIAGTAISVLRVAAFLAIAALFGIRMPIWGYVAALPAVFVAGLMLGAPGFAPSSMIRQLENFAGVMNFVIFPMFFLSSALYLQFNAAALGWTLLAFVIFGTAALGGYDPARGSVRNRA